MFYVFKSGSERGTRGLRLTTGCYEANTAGGVMPPLYIFDSEAAKEDTIQVKPEWVDVLP